MGQSSSLTSREKTLLAASRALDNEDIPNRLLALREDLETGIDTFAEMEHVERLSAAIITASRLHTQSIEMLRALLEEKIDEPVKKAILHILSGKILSRNTRRIASLLQDDAFWDPQDATRHSVIGPEAGRIVQELETQAKAIQKAYKTSEVNKLRAERVRLTLYELAKDGQTNV